MRRSPYALLLASALLALTGCDQLGIESATAVAARKEADGKAIGGACRHAGRAIEDCYVLNRKADRAAIYSGWREMNEYMRENKLEPVVPQLDPDARVAARSTPAAETGGEEGSAAESTTHKPGAKPGDKHKAPQGDTASQRSAEKGDDKPATVPPRRRPPP
ncbi:MAG: hypothetical protein L6Q73_01135 [Aquabacterium sp.]|nr:hypothetical protein [Aquabacterium sp.]